MKKRTCSYKQLKREMETKKRGEILTEVVEEGAR